MKKENNASERLKVSFRDYSRRYKLPRLHNHLVDHRLFDKFNACWDWPGIVWTILIDLSARYDYFAEKAEYLSDADRQKILASLKKALDAGEKLLNYDFNKESDNFHDIHCKIETKPLEDESVQLQFIWDSLDNETLYIQMRDEERLEYEKAEKEFFDTIRDNLFDWWY